MSQFTQTTQLLFEYYELGKYDWDMYDIGTR